MTQVVIDPSPQIPEPTIFIPPPGAPPWETLPPAVFLLIVIAMVAGSVFIFAPLARALAKRIEGGTTPKLRAEVAELHARLDAMEQHALQSGQFEGAEHRMYELEERVEFVERLMSRGGEGGNASRT
jgi:tetrahydromethanopterin S-methyltransferase subunit G